MAKINVRSPYYVYKTQTKLQSAILNIWIYSGTQTTSRPAAATYTLRSFAINEAVNYEIAELVRDYMTYSAESYETPIVWVDYQLTKVVAGVTSTETLVANKGFYGFGYFEDGYNPQLNADFLQSNKTIVKLDDAPIYLPIDTNRVTEVSFYHNNEKVYEQNFSPNTNSDNQIQYVTNTDSPADRFRDRVLSFNQGSGPGIFEGSICFDEFSNEIEVFPVDTIYVYSLYNSGGGREIKVKNIEECKYEPYKISFINKYGALQDIWFFKTSSKELTTKRESFKRNTLVANNYSLNEHQDKNLYKRGNEKMSLNTGFYPEEYNEVFKQMQLSEDAWIRIDGKSLPINITDSGFGYKTSLNDKLINYNIKIEFAFDTINNIR
ncbi:MAG: hypothetical protein QNK89_04560 [Lacinutrix sp.]|uniref:hypothetical protein n=1 Tax=Lacinutrix sp. TaxID=1937692 RepID=UPI00309B09F9